MSVNVSQDAKKDNMKIAIKVAIMLLVTFGVGYLPPFGDITPFGMKVLGAFLGTLFGWLTLDFIVSSFVGLLALGIAGWAGGISGTMAQGFSDSTVVLMVFSFILVAGLNKVDLTGALAAWLLTRKFAQGKPYVILAVIMAAAFLIGAVSSFASMLLLWNIMYKIADKVGLEKRSNLMAYMLTGIVLFAGNGGYLFPWKGGSIMFASPLTGLGVTIPQVQWYSIVIVSTIAFIAFWILLAFVMRLDVSGFKNEDLFTEFEGFKWSKEQLWGLGMFAFVILFLTIPEFLPATPFVKLWKSIGIIGVTIIIVTVGYVVSVNGKRLFTNIAELCKEGMMWDVWIMIIATMPLSAAMKSADTGIITTAINFAMGLFGDMHWILFTIVCAVVTGLLTQVTHNIVIALVMFPPLAQMCINMGGSPILWWFVNFWAIVAAYTTPAASGYAAILHGNTEWLSPKQAYGFGFGTLVISWLGSFLVLIPFYLLFFN